MKLGGNKGKIFGREFQRLRIVPEILVGQSEQDITLDVSVFIHSSSLRTIVVSKVQVCIQVARLFLKFCVVAANNSPVLHVS